MEGRLARLKEWIRPEVRGLQPYTPEPTGPGIRLDANESPFDMPEELKRAVWDSFSHQAWNRYPDPECLELRQAVADYEGVTPGQIVCGNGSDEIIRDLLVCFGGPGTRTIFPTPTFTMYRLLTIALGGTPVGVRLQADWSLDLEAFLPEASAETSRIIFLPSPNNPTGNIFPAEQIEGILKKTDCLLVVDEAYRLFAKTSLVSRLQEYPNLVILCTYSKAMSAAGVRIGYLLGHPQVVEAINRVRLPYNIDAFAQRVAIETIKRPDIWEQQARQISEARERLSKELSQMKDVTVYPSQANFILVRVPEAERIKEQLWEQDIAVRGFPKTEGLSACLRITIGTADENAIFLQQFRLALQA